MVRFYNGEMRRAISKDEVERRATEDGTLD